MRVCLEVKANGSYSRVFVALQPVCFMPKYPGVWGSVVTMSHHHHHHHRLQAMMGMCRRRLLTKVDNGREAYLGMHINICI